MKPLRLINMGAIDSIQTQAVYHAVAETMQEDTPDTIIINSTKTPYVCLGYHQEMAMVIDKSKCDQLGIPVVRRKLGGGATYLDSNQLFYQCIFHKESLPAQFKHIYTKLLQPAVETLRAFGLNAALREINEIEIDGKRVAGTGGGQIENACVVVGNFLFDFDFDVMTNVWNTPSEQYRILAGSAMRERISTLLDYDSTLTKENVTKILTEMFSKVLDREIEFGKLTKREIRRSKKLVHELTSPEFLSQRGDPIQKIRKPLKISAGVFVHDLEVNLKGFRYKGSILTIDDIIEDYSIERLSNIGRHKINVQLKGIIFSEWENHLEDNRAYSQ